jgi:P-type Ca2+ transporter type 2C
MTTVPEHVSTDPPHRLGVAAAADHLGVDPRSGLDPVEAARRLDQHGPNALAPAPKVPAWSRFLAQFRDLLILILLAAAVVSFVVSREIKTPAVVLVVVLVNAVIGFVQENRAEASLDALRKMLVTQARVRRGGEARTVPAEELVPGDIVSIEAGDRVPADGRLLEAVLLEIEEAALTGESVPTVKATDAIDRAEVPLGDRRNMAFMNTTVTRGRGTLLVTGTAMETEIGRIAGLLRDAEVEKTPLQHQLDGLAHSLAKLAGVIVGLVVVIGLVRGLTLGDLFLTAVALAVATIPEGLPAVTAVTLAIGVSKMARQEAIVKRLAGVETLGCTSVICTDKTGTLTLNQMTAVELVVEGGSHAVTGEGYDPTGTIEGGSVDGPTGRALLPLALCSDATIRRDDGGTWELVGDPTEGAVVTLAAKGGVDIAAARASHPRLAEVPFDSAHKFMATVHEVARPDGTTVVRLYAKGALDVLLDRAAAAVGPAGAVVPLSAMAAAFEAHNARLADRGLRVLAVAQRDLGAGEWPLAAGVEPACLVHDLTVLAIVGIVDPPRVEAATAIAEARAAGIDVKMITGDHATTATAIGTELRLTGDGRPVVAVTGTELDRMDDEELRARLPGISVFARVAPEHKLRLVAALQGQGHVVAMTGDGVNDAPALKQADIGVAMGITGTEVTKEAATMVLTDDNFATIVGAVRQGRTIYDNIVKFVRFQLSTTLGFAALFLAAAVLGIANGKPFTAIAILWVNIIMDGPPAMALGLDRSDADVMERLPRPRSERILTRWRWTTVLFSAVIMATGTLAVLAWAPGEEPIAGVATVAGTMAFNTFVVFQFFNILNARSDRLSVFRRETLTNDKLWIALGAVLALQVGVTHLGPLQRLFDTTSLSATQWLVCVAVASSVLWLEELRKVVIRRREIRPGRTASSAAAGATAPVPAG